jgi:hypothetical protein
MKPLVIAEEVARASARDLLTRLTGAEKPRRGSSRRETSLENIIKIRS